MAENGHFLVFSEVENDEQMLEVKTIISERLDTRSVSVLVLGNLAVDSPVVTVAGHLIWLFRKHGLQRNEREMVLSYQDMLVTCQLCLAEDQKQKTGEFDIEVSKVLEMFKYLTDDKLGSSSPADSEDYTKFKRSYEAYLKGSNLVDCMDVLSRLRAEVLVNDALKTEVDSTDLLVLNPTGNTVEQAMVRWLSEGKKCYTTSMESSLDDSHLDTATYTLQPLAAVCDGLDGVTGRAINTPGHMGGRSVTESYAEKVVMSYLHLLVNTRSEMALALVMNIPERELDHKAFTAVKREAKTKNMSMYQAMVSHVMRIRLGGKSYAPCSASPLSQHVKGLAEFTDLIHRLMNVIEEETNTRVAVKKVLNSLKKAILKAPDNSLRRESIEAVTLKLQHFAEATIEGHDRVTEDSPQRDAYHGGSLIGRQTLRIIRAIVDRFSSRLPGVASHVDLLTDVFSSQATPVRFPSLMSKFRSPLEASPGSKESQSLAQRMKDKIKVNPTKVTCVPRFQSSLDWAAPVHSVGLTHRSSINAMVMEDYIPSKTVVHAGKSVKETSSVARKVLETIHDQENSTQAATPATAASQQHKPHKRTLSVSAQQPAAKKSKKSAAAKTGSKSSAAAKTSKKKVAPLQKGQKQLTAFFRI